MSCGESSAWLATAEFARDSRGFDWTREAHIEIEVACSALTGDCTVSSFAYLRAPIRKSTIAAIVPNGEDLWKKLKLMAKLQTKL